MSEPKEYDCKCAHCKKSFKCAYETAICCSDCIAEGCWDRPKKEESDALKNG